MNAEKNQGLVAKDREYYMEGMLQQHCLNKDNYVQLTATQAFNKMKEVELDLIEVINLPENDTPVQDFQYFQKASS